MKRRKYPARFGVDDDDDQEAADPATANLPQQCSSPDVLAPGEGNNAEGWTADGMTRIGPEMGTAASRGKSSKVSPMGMRVPLLEDGTDQKDAVPSAAEGPPAARPRACFHASTPSPAASTTLLQALRSAFEAARNKSQGTGTARLGAPVPAGQGHSRAAACSEANFRLANARAADPLSWTLSTRVVPHSPTPAELTKASRVLDSRLASLEMQFAGMGMECLEKGIPLGLEDFLVGQAAGLPQVRETSTPGIGTLEAVSFRSPEWQAPRVPSLATREVSSTSAVVALLATFPDPPELCSTALPLEAQLPTCAELRQLTASAAGSLQAPAAGPPSLAMDNDEMATCPALPDFSSGAEGVLEAPRGSGTADICSVPHPSPHASSSTQMAVLRHPGQFGGGAENALKGRLLLAACALERGDKGLFRDLLRHFASLGKANGIAQERFVHHMRKALLLRANGSDFAWRMISKRPRIPLDQFDLAFKCYALTVPKYSFASVCSTGLAVPHLVGHEEVHFIIHGFVALMQLPAALRVLRHPDKQLKASPSSGAPGNQGALRHVHVTVLDTYPLSVPAYRRMVEVVCWGQAQWALEATAEAIGVRLSYRAIHLEQDSLEVLDTLQPLPGVVAAVCIGHELSMCSSNAGSEQSTRDKVLQAFSRLRPKVLTMSEYDYAGSETEFLTRFTAAMHHSWGLFSSHDEYVQQENHKRLLHIVEDLCHSHKLQSIIACEGTQRRHTPCTRQQLKDVLQAWGFAQAPPSSLVIKGLQKVLHRFPTSTSLVQDGHWLVLLYRGLSVSCGGCFFLSS